MERHEPEISLSISLLKGLIILCGLILVTSFLSAQSYTGPEPRLLFKQYHESKPDSGRVQLLLQLGSFYIYKRGEARRNLDSAIFFTNAASELSNKLNYEKGKDEAAFLAGIVYVKSHAAEKFDALLKKSPVNIQVRLMLEMIRYNAVILGMKANEIDSAMLFATVSLHLSETLHSAFLTAQSYLELSNLNYQKHDLLKGRDFFLKALDIARKSGNVEAEAAVFSQSSGNVMTDESLIEELLNSGTRLLTFLQGIRNKERYLTIQQLVVMGYDQLSYYYTYKGNLNQALFYSLEMVKMLEKDGNPGLNEFPYQTIGKIYLDQGKLQQSIEYIKTAGDIVSRKAEILDATALKNITKAYIGLGRPQDALAFLNEQVKPGRYEDVINLRLIAESMGNCYFEMKQYDEAEKFYLESLRFGKRSNYQSKLVSYVPLSRLYVISKKYSKARPYLYELIADSNRAMVPITVQRDVHFMLFQADSAAGNFKTAIFHFRQNKILNDSIFNETRNRQLEQLNLQYETDKKNKDLKLKEQNIQLLTKHGELQEADLIRTRFSRNVFVGAMVVLFAILGMVINRYRFKLKTNKRLQQKQEEINRTNQQLQRLIEEQQKLITEKEWLVKEIHHRVKNNLQMIISLLNAQSEFLDHPSALNAIKESRERMQAIALIHQKLYQPGNGTMINMNSYIQEMVAYLANSFADTKRIQFKLDIEEIYLDVSQSVPLGLILNEAITNAMKYAFLKDQNGTVGIELHYLNANEILLKVSDNGQGFPQEFDLAEGNSLGIQLIRLFAEQLDGNLHIGSTNGVEISLTFKQQYPVNANPSFTNTRQADGENINS